MNYTFKCGFKGSWTITDNQIVFKKKVIPLDAVVGIEHKKGFNKYIEVSYKSEGWLNVGGVESVMLFYYEEQQAEADIVAEYLESLVYGPETSRKICNVCGHIFCYTRDDVKRNKILLKASMKEDALGLGNTLGGANIAANQHIQRADNLTSKMVDYSKCPQCGSKELSDASDKDVENHKVVQGGPQPQTSVADEIKKFKELLDSGIITQEEFDAKKKQLLGL